MGRLVVVSNRVIGPDGPGAGGLAVAIAAALRGRPSLWFGWSGEHGPGATDELAVRRVGGLEFATTI